MNESECLSKMIAPSMVRPGRYRGGIMQVHVTRACDMACFHCTQGSNLGGKPVVMTVEQFEIACESLQDYWGVIGIFGGNPALHPQFEELCNVLCRYFPWAQRGLWCNHPRGHGKLMRDVFNPAVSNLNVHLSQEAYDEFKRDWPECAGYLKGLEDDSRHSPPFVAMIDQENLTESDRWDLISRCDVNHDWSAMVCVVNNEVQGFFCEIAGAQAMLHQHDASWPNLGVNVKTEPAWWRKPMQEFSEQVRHYCHRCGVPMRRHGQLAVGGQFEEVSETHKDIYKPKSRDREVQLVQINDGATLQRMTEYIENGREEKRHD
jgi:hypothetical protein